MFGDDEVEVMHEYDVTFGKVIDECQPMDVANGGLALPLSCVNHHTGRGEVDELEEGGTGTLG